MNLFRLQETIRNTYKERRYQVFANYVERIQLKIEGKRKSVCFIEINMRI